MGQEDALRRFRELLSIRTVAPRDPDARAAWQEFDRYAETLERLYPRIHRELEARRVDGHTLLYRWRGADAGSPAVLMAHYDVVPATDDGWEHPPFDAVTTGEGDDRVVWGRGALDDKGAMVTILEAVEAAIEDGFRPAHDIWLCFGHDEETFGTGASTAVDVLHALGVRPRLVLDEGGAIVEGVFPGVDRPVAVVGVAEKGLATFTLTVAQQGGHAFAPPALPATDRLARAIRRLGQRPFRPRLVPAVRAMNRVIATAANGAVGLGFRTLGWAGPLVTTAFGRLGDETRALTRTTAVVTMIEAGHAPNALPERAVATVNVRILPGDTVASVAEHIRRAVRDDRVSVAVHQGVDPSPTSPSEGPTWTLIEQTIAQLHPQAVVTPYLMLGATDARHFTRISEHVYRFSPFEISAAERTGLHGMNERIRLSTFFDGIRFYRALIQRL